MWVSSLAVVATMVVVSLAVVVVDFGFGFGSLYFVSVTRAVFVSSARWAGESSKAPFPPMGTRPLPIFKMPERLFSTVYLTLLTFMLTT